MANIKNYICAEIDNFDPEEAIEIFGIQDSDFVEP